MCLVLKFSTMKWMTESIRSDYHRNIIWTQESLPWFGPLEPGNRTVPSSLIFQGDRKKLFFAFFPKLNPIHLILCHWSVKSVYDLLQQFTGKKKTSKWEVATFGGLWRKFNGTVNCSDIIHYHSMQWKKWQMASEVLWWPSCFSICTYNYLYLLLHVMEKKATYQICSSKHFKTSLISNNKITTILISHCLRNVAL